MNWRGRRADYQRGAGHRRSGGTPGAQAGIGLHPLIDEEKVKILPLLADLVNGSQKPGFNLAKASGVSMQLTRGVVEALRDDPDVAVLTERLAGELALARVTEQALLARRTRGHARTEYRQRQRGAGEPGQNHRPTG